MLPINDNTTITNDNRPVADEPLLSSFGSAFRSIYANKCVNSLIADMWFTSDLY